MAFLFLYKPNYFLHVHIPFPKCVSCNFFGLSYYRLSNQLCSSIRLSIIESFIIKLSAIDFESQESNYRHSDYRNQNNFLSISCSLYNKQKYFIQANKLKCLNFNFKKYFSFAPAFSHRQLPPHNDEINKGTLKNQNRIS